MRKWPPAQPPLDSSSALREAEDVLRRAAVEDQAVAPAQVLEQRLIEVVHDATALIISVDDVEDPGPKRPEDGISTRSLTDDLSCGPRSGSCQHPGRHERLDSVTEQPLMPEG
jgi:hypothetical protein